MTRSSVAWGMYPGCKAASDCSRPAVGHTLLNNRLGAVHLTSDKSMTSSMSTSAALTSINVCAVQSLASASTCVLAYLLCSFPQGLLLQTQVPHLDCLSCKRSLHSPVAAVVQNPKERITLNKMMKHPWVTRRGGWPLRSVKEMIRVGERPELPPVLPDLMSTLNVLDIPRQVPIIPSTDPPCTFICKRVRVRHL